MKCSPVKVSLPHHSVIVLEYAGIGLHEGLNVLVPDLLANDPAVEEVVQQLLAGAQAERPVDRVRQRLRAVGS
jgi:hypothetical protein